MELKTSDDLIEDERIMSNRKIRQSDTISKCVTLCSNNIEVSLVMFNLHFYMILIDVEYLNAIITPLMTFCDHRSVRLEKLKTDYQKALRNIDFFCVVSRDRRSKKLTKLYFTLILQCRQNLVF